MVRICKLNHYDQSIYSNWIVPPPKSAVFSNLLMKEMEGFMIETHKQTLLEGWDKDTHFISGPDWNLENIN